MAISREEIVEKVKQSLAQVLDIEVTEISLDQSLVNDLGVDSLDFLDLVFRLESVFGIRIKRREIEGRARGFMSKEGFEVGGVVTSEGLEALRRAMPEVPEERFREGMLISEIPSLFTVATFVRLVQSKLEEKNNEFEG